MTGFDLSALDLSSFVDRLAGPVGLKLSLALVHFLWQGVLIAAGAALLMRVLGRRSARLRYAIGVGGLALMAVAPVVTFCLVTPPQPVQPTEAVTFDAAELEVLIADLEASIGAAGENEPAAVPLTWPERLRLWQPYSLLLWLAGTGVFALRLGIGAQASWRFGRGKKALPEAWLRIAAEVAGRVGIKAPRVFLSDRIAEAVAVGLLRPMVLIPAAWLGRIPPEVLEAVLAHELAHLRRYDLWVNLLQRCVEAALFYHPAVWWLSRRVRVEREYCCDEAAAQAVLGRAAYARALEFVAAEAVTLRRAAAARPAVFGTALAAGMGGDSMALLDRVRRVLGAEDKPPRGRLSEGLIALAVPAALWAAVATVGPALAQADEAKENAAKEESNDAAEIEPKGDGDGGDQIGDIESWREQGVEDGDVTVLRGDVLLDLATGRVIADKAERWPPRDSEDILMKAPILGDLPIVGRLFQNRVLAEADQPGELAAEIHRSGSSGEAGDVGAALRELRGELKALRAEVERMRGGKTGENASIPPRVKAALAKRVSLHFDKVPLSEAVRAVQGSAGIDDVNFVIDDSGLAEEGVTADRPISIDLKEVSVGTALRQMLAPLSLGYVVDNEVIAITGKGRSRGPLVVEVHAVSDLVGVEGDPEGVKARFDFLTDLVTGAVQPETWEQVGGRGVIKPNDATLSLVIRQTPDVHQQIRDLLQKLREMRRGTEIRKEFDAAIAARNEALQQWRDAEEKKTGTTEARKRYFEARARVEHASNTARRERPKESAAGDTETKRDEARSNRKGIEVRVVEGNPPRVVTYWIDENSEQHKVKEEAIGGPLPPKPPAAAGELKIEARQTEEQGPVRYILRKPGDDKNPQRFEFRVFKEGGPKEGDESPDRFIKRLHVEQADGQPRVFLYREGKDGQPEKVEGKVEDGEAVIELEDGRIHVRPLKGSGNVAYGPIAAKPPTPPVPPSPPGAENAVPARISRVATLELDGKKVPVVVEEFRESEKGPAKEIRVRVLQQAPPGTDVYPDPATGEKALREKVIRDLEEKVKELQRQLDERKGAAAGQKAERLVRSYQLSRSRADEVKRVLEQSLGLGKEGVPPDVSITADERTNSILVQAPPDAMDIVGRVVETLDRDAVQALRDAAELKRATLEAFAREKRGERDPQIEALRREIEQLDNLVREKVEAERQRAEAATREAEAQRQARAATDAEMKKLVDTYNELVKQRSYAEAMMVAKRAKELDPANPVTVTMLYKAKVLYESEQNEKAKRQDEGGARKAEEEAEKAREQETKARGEAARAELEKAEAEVRRAEEELRRLQSLEEAQRSAAQLDVARAVIEKLKIDAAALREAKAEAEKKRADAESRDQKNRETNDPVEAKPAEPPKQPVSDVRIKGNRTIAASSILQHIKSRPGGSDSDRQIGEDVQALFRTQWFASVEPHVAHTDVGPVLTFKVTERTDGTEPALDRATAWLRDARQTFGFYLGVMH